MSSIPPLFSAEVKNMVVRSQSEIDEALPKRDLVALREILKNQSPSALVRVMTKLDTEDQMIVRRILPRELSTDLPILHRFEVGERLLLTNQLIPIDFRDR